MKKIDVKIIYTAFIVVGAALIFYQQSQQTSQKTYILAIGFVLLMFGLYKATNQWVKDNKEPPHEEDDIFFEDDETR